MARTRFQSPTAKEPQFCSFIFSSRPIWAFWPPKSPKRASWEKVWWLDSWRVLEKILLPIGTKPISPYIINAFSGLQQKLLMTLFLQVSMSKFLSGRIQFCCFIFLRRPILAFWPPKIQKERLEKRFGGSTPGESWKMNIYKAKYGLVPLGKRIFSRTRQESSHQTFSQDALFGLFGGQKAQIGRLEKIEPPNLFSRCSCWTFWRPKSSNWTSWENRAIKPFLKMLFLDFLAAKELKLDVLRKKTQARFPAGLDSVGLIETLYDSFHLSE